ncbi:ABC transporter substrate-binding protein [Leifsonia poae]|uniref:ABC transporter substrate-binding protein n=1 Tax=Leifsonia poae TaxID=110933 RepID=UPI001CBCB645|nr:sugar ABC transporter substrate-binding protein [Leifsonia poae]
MKRGKALTAVAAMLAGITAVALSGCSQGNGGSDEKVTLEYANFSSSPDHTKQLDAIIAAFEKSHPNIAIKVTTAAYDNYFTNVRTRVSGGSAPDTFELDYANYLSFAGSDALLDLNSNGLSVDSSVYAKKPYQSFTLSGKQYGLPESFSSVVLAYNKTMFDKAGLAYPTNSWTWADEQAAAKKLTDRAAGIYGDYQPVQFSEFYKAIAQAGGSILNANKTKAVFDSTAGVKAANWLIGKVGTTMPTAAQLGSGGESQLFLDGKLAMMEQGIWAFSELDSMKDDWDIVVDPGDAQKASQFFSNAAVISKSTKHPKEALEWIEYLTSSDTTVQQRISSAWEVPAISDQSKLSAYLTAGKPANRQAVLDSIEHVVLPPGVKQESQLENIITLALQQAQQGKDVEQALSDAAKQVDTLLG